MSTKLGARQKHALSVEVLDEHETFQRPLADAISAAFSLVLDPIDPRGLEHVRTVWRFIECEALPHMAQEEQGVFPHAHHAGVPGEVVHALAREHHALRTLAEELRDRGFGGRARPDDEGALMALRFLQSFDAHVQREEAIFALYDATDRVRSRWSRARTRMC
jgi:hemerythrin-like domain-containing protein